MARITVNDTEKSLIEKARELANLQAKRRSIAAELDACDKDIERASQSLRELTPKADAEK
jgi:hypothetical protein